MSQQTAAVNLRYGLRALRRRLPIFVAVAVLVPAIAVVYSLLQKKEYTATASLLFRDPQFDQKLFGTSFVQTQNDPTRTAATNVDLVSLRRVAALTAQRFRDITEDQVQSDVSIGSSAQSDVVSVQAKARTPQFAAKLANSYASEYIAFRENADRTTIKSAEVPLRQQIASLPSDQRFGQLGQSLQQRLSQLRTLSMLQTGGAELVQPAEVPHAPSSPKPARNGVLGLFFGVLLGLGLVVVAEALDRRVRDPGEVEALYERPLLAAVPRSAALSAADPALAQANAAESEAFRMLWVNLRYFSLSRDISSVLVTSADRDDGKSTVAWGLALAAASAGKRTLVIEADLRNPTLARRFDAPRHNGLTNVLTGDVTREDAIMRLRLPANADQPGAERSLDVLFAGARPPDPADLLQSRRMAEFVADVEEAYEFVVMDTPPAALVSDAVPLIALVRGVIVVSRLGNTVREHSRRLHQQLAHLDAPVLGVVVNAIGTSDRYGYAYSYGYGYGEAPGSRLASTNAVGANGVAAEQPSVPAEQRRGDQTEAGSSSGANGVAAGSGTARRRRLTHWLK